MVKKRHLLPLQFSTAGIILAMMLIFFPPFAKAFVGDDYVQLDYVLAYVARPLAAIEVFNPYWTGWYYRPLQNIWFLLNRVVFGYDPFGYYWLGLLAHGLAIAMLVGLARKVGLRWETAVACGTLFAIQKHYVDVVTWISAVAIVLAGLFSMAALATYTKYLRKQHGCYLFTTFLFFLLTLLSHEEGFFLPPLLLLWRLLHQRLPGRKGKRIFQEMPSGEWGFFCATAVLLGLYLYFQVTRSNLTISVQDAVTAGGWQLVAPLPLSQFITDTVGKFVPIPGLTGWLMPVSYAAAFLTVALLAVWFWRGGGLVRLGIAWGALHLAFIYVALWGPKPELYAGRHIYQAWIGLVLAVGAGLESLPHRQKQEIRWRNKRVGNGRYLTSRLGILLLIVLFSHVRTVRDVQADWLANTQEEASARRQLQTLLPTVDDSMHIFAYRFPITPNFLRSVLQVWYERDEPYRQPFGPLERLQAHGKATPHFTLLDWDGNGRLYNLMPELQESAQTTFVWASPARVEVTSGASVTEDAEGVQILSVTGPPDDRRLAVQVEPPPGGEWRSMGYEVVVPEGAVLQTAVRGADDPAAAGDGLRFRLRLARAGQSETLLDVVLAAGDAGWHEVILPVDAYGETAVTLHLEVSGTGKGYWANPRFTK